MIPDPAAQAARAQHMETLRHMRKRQEAAMVAEPREGMLSPEVFQQRIAALDYALDALAAGSLTLHQQREGARSEEHDHGAGLIGQTIPDVAETEPRLSVGEARERLNTQLRCMADEIRAWGTVVDAQVDSAIDDLIIASALTERARLVGSHGNPSVGEATKVGSVSVSGSEAIGLNAQERSAPVEEALRLAKMATNGWACYARTAIEHDAVAKLHRDIDDLRAAVRAEGRGAERG